jgi:hypothetical protein
VVNSPGLKCVAGQTGMYNTVASGARSAADCSQSEFCHAKACCHTDMPVVASCARSTADRTAVRYAVSSGLESPFGQT